MTNKTAEYLEQLSKEQLVFIIKKLQSSLCCIGEICVDESKWKLNSNESVELIRERLRGINDLSHFHIYNDKGIEELRERIDRMREKENK